MGVIVLIIVVVGGIVLFNFLRDKWDDKKFDKEWKEKQELGDKYQNEAKEFAESDAKAQALTDTDKLAEIGIAFYSKKEFKKALPFLAKAALQKHMIAEFHLGSMFSHGDGVVQDYAKARYWYERAADQGDADAQNNLGLLYFNGQGGKKDDVWALNFFEKSAKQGNEEAKRNLGCIPNIVKQAHEIHKAEMRKSGDL